MTDTWTLHGSGRRDHDAWDYLHALTRDWTAAWAGIDRFHLDRLPDQPPVTTHLWAWTTNTWLRVRIDGVHWWAALLTRGTSAEDEPWTTSESIEEPAVTSLRHWQSTERQAMQYNGDAGVLDVHGSFEQLVPLRRTTGVFRRPRQLRAARPAAPHHRGLHRQQGRQPANELSPLPLSPVNGSTSRPQLMQCKRAPSGISCRKGNRRGEPMTAALGRDRAQTRPGAAKVTAHGGR